MHGALLAVVHPDNTPHGANLTFAIPILVFVIIAAALFLRFRAPHSVPGRVPFKSSRWVTAGHAGRAAFGEDAVDAAVGTHAEPAGILRMPRTRRRRHQVLFSPEPRRRPPRPAARRRHRSR